MTFENKVAIVTGAAGGIGAAIATRLHAEGASVTIADNTLSRITVTNIVEDPFEVPATDVASENTVAAATPPRGATPPSGVAAVLAHTGADTAGPLIVAGFMILLGLAGLFARSLSRRQRHERR